ncbi:MAG TPA: hypothetical protein VFR41_06375 [Acidimicrobiia bacterium]|nr:hypothetical protein [Acidimicrobiia bacterium]
MAVSPLKSLERVARRQHGLFSLEQAQSFGLARRTIYRRIEQGCWCEVAPRVYRASPSATLSWHQVLMAATMSANAHAARRSAAALYGLLKPPSTPEVLVVRSKRNLDRKTVHSTLDLPASDCTVVGHIPATTPTRTLIDVSAELSRRGVDDLVDTALVRGLVRLVPLERRARELLAPARPGASRVLRSLRSSHPELERARNKWEARVLRLVARHGLAEPIPNFKLLVAGRPRELDLAWPDALVCVEFDGYEPHSGREVFDDDRARQNMLVDAGWRIFRLTAPMLESRRALDPVARALAESHSCAIYGTAV